MRINEKDRKLNLSTNKLRKGSYKIRYEHHNTYKLLSNLYSNEVKCLAYI